MYKPHMTDISFSLLTSVTQSVGICLLLATNILGLLLCVSNGTVFPEQALIAISWSMLKLWHL